MNRSDEFNELIKQLDHSDPTQVQAMIDLIGQWLEDNTNSPGFQARLISARTHLWLDLWQINQDRGSIENAANNLVDSLENHPLSFLDLLAIERVFNIFRALYSASKVNSALDMAISWGMIYLLYATKEYPNYLININNHANLLRNRYRLSGIEDDLDKSIELYEEALGLTSEGDKNLPSILSNLAKALEDRYALRGKAEDLDKSIELYEEALALTGEGDKDRPALLKNLADELGKRYAMGEKLEDLDKRIECIEEALGSTSEGDEDRLISLFDLAAALGVRYALTAKSEDLDKNIECIEEALALTGEGDKYLSRRTSNLAKATEDRYALSGKAEDLDKGIELYREALALIDEGDKGRPAMLNNLAIALGDRYALKGKEEDLDNRIELHELALVLTAEADKGRPRRLSNLAVALGDRYALRGKAEDLDKRIELVEEALALTAERDKDRPMLLNNLAVVLEEVYTLRGKSEYLEKSIELYEIALKLTEKGSKNHPRFLNNLANALVDRFMLKGKDEDLDNSIKLYEEALKLTAEGHKDRNRFVNNLAKALGDRYALRGKPEDLDKSIKLIEEALALIPEGDKDRPILVNNLAATLGDRYAYSNIDDDAIKAIEYYQLAIKLLNDGHTEKPKIQRNLGDLCVRVGNYLSALEAYEGMAASLEMLRSANPGKRDREKILSDYAHGFAQLVFCCIKLNEPEKALRYAEAAKSRALVDALHNQVTDISNLATQDETLKANLEELQKLQHEINWLLRQLGAGDENISWIDPNTSRFRRPLDEINADLKDKRAKEQELWEILEKHSPVFAMTVSAPPFHLQDALALADEENAALISYYQHSQGWIAFIVSKREFFIAELQGVEDLLETYQSAFSNLHSPFGKILLSCVLEEAWQVLIQPLQRWLPAEGTNLVIAPFAGLHHLPFAAFTNPEGGRCLVDHYCLKTITSLGTLRAMRNQAQIQAEVRTKNQEMTVVGYASIPSSPSYLPAVEDEVNAISRLFSLPHPLIGEDARINDVLTQAPGSHVLHFACHGMFDPKQPHHSGLMLEDGWLTVRDILIRMNLSGTDMVVMSSCLSGLSRISQGEELTGLLTAFISARAKSVVGSLWSVDDRSTAELMVRFYELISKGWERSAALREAQLFIRKQPQWQHPYYWSPFFLTGVG